MWAPRASTQDFTTLSTMPTTSRPQTAMKTARPIDPLDQSQMAMGSQIRIGPIWTSPSMKVRSASTGQCGTPTM